MSNRYIYPTEKFKVKLDLEIDVKYVGVWDGFDSSFLQNRYDEMKQDESFTQLLKDVVLGELTRRTYTNSDVHPFDVICFDVEENKLGDKQWNKYDKWFN